MARIGITFEQVAAVADALIGESQQPTIRAVRERLGDTGSPNTIHKYLTAWREARPYMVTSIPELPVNLAIAITTEIERAAAQARAEIESRLVQTQIEAAELSTAGEALEIERDELTEQVGTLTRERDTLAGKAAHQAATLIEQSQRIEREQQTAESARVELATARLKIESQSEKQIEHIAELEELRAALKIEQEKTRTTEKNAAVLVAKLEAMTNQLAKEENRSEQLTKELNTIRGQIDDARNETGKAREHTARLTGQLDSAQEHAVRLTRQLDALQTASKEKSKPPRMPRQSL